jgi:catechol 2,3-dioxygenase-like lactoylglutathione lyase family enzyme
MTPLQARYVHTNVIARDWRALASFYQTVFGCIPVPPERDYQGPALDAGTALTGTRLTGVHLRLPGWGDAGPTLEIYTYAPTVERAATVVNRPGYGHIAFEVDDVGGARQAVLDAGGRAIGEVVTLTTVNGARVTWCYVTDPEDNMIELQAWTPAGPPAKER